MTETWRAIPSFPLYEVSDEGRVRRGGRMLKSSSRNGGYHEVVLSLGTRDTRKNRRLHHLVLEAFVAPKPEGQVGRHLDDNQNNNRLDNLSWGTQKQNAEDRLRNGGYERATSCWKGHPLDPNRKFGYCPECNRQICASRAREVRERTGEWETTRRFREDEDFRERRLAQQRDRRALARKMKDEKSL